MQVPMRRFVAVGAVLATILMAVAPAASSARPARPALAPCTPPAPLVIGTQHGFTLEVRDCPGVMMGSVDAYRIEDGSFVASGGRAPGSRYVRLAGGNLDFLLGVTSFRFRGWGGGTDTGLVGSASAPAAPNPFTSTDAAITKGFHDFLGINPTSTMRTAAKTRILDQGLADFLAWLEVDPSWQEQYPITRLYLSYLQRVPDIAGLSHWTMRHRAGVSIDRISAAFATSSEFLHTYGPLDDGQFVRTVYRNVLRREADPAGERHWTNLLTSHRRTRGSVMASFSESNEHVRRVQPTVTAISWMSGLWGTVPSTKVVDRFVFDAAYLSIGPERLAMRDDRFIERVGPAGPPVIQGASYRTATVGAAYKKETLLFSHTGRGAIRWALSGLPPGLTTTKLGTLVGTPTQAGDYVVTVRATDSYGMSDSHQMALTVAPA